MNTRPGLPSGIQTLQTQRSPWKVWGLSSVPYTRASRTTPACRGISPHPHRGVLITGCLSPTPTPLSASLLHLPTLLQQHCDAFPFPIYLLRKPRHRAVMLLHPGLYPGSSRIPGRRGAPKPVLLTSAHVAVCANGGNTGPLTSSQLQNPPGDHRGCSVTPSAPS